MSMSTRRNATQLLPMINAYFYFRESTSFFLLGANGDERKFIYEIEAFQNA